MVYISLKIKLVSISKNYLNKTFEMKLMLLKPKKTLIYIKNLGLIMMMDKFINLYNIYLGNGKLVAYL